MAFQRFIDAGDDLRRVVFRYRAYKRVHDPEITAAVAGQDAAVVADLCVHLAGRVVQEFAHGDGDAVGLDLSERTEDPRFAPRNP